MKIGIHSSKGSFSDRWITYCEENRITYKVVDCYRSDIIQQLADCDALMWHFHQQNPKDTLFAKQLLYSIEIAGKKVFPNYRTSWHFDDKVGQKYLLESVSAPLVPSYVFYSEKDALMWVSQATFPKVFKLRGGAGSNNVFLIRSRHDAAGKVRQAFRQGFPQDNGWRIFWDHIERQKMGRPPLLEVLKSFLRTLYPTKFTKFKGNEKGYVYFQDFIPDNDHDIRIVVIGNRAFGIKRFVRKNDFRASGSGQLLYRKQDINETCLPIAFGISHKISAQCMTYDFIFDKQNGPLVTEISYGFSKEPYDTCQGYWDSELNWHEGPFNFCGWMVEDLVNEINKSTLKS